MTFELRQKLNRVAGRIRRLRFWSGLTLCWVVWAIAGIVLSRLAPSYDWDTASLWPKLAIFALATAAAWAFLVHRTARDERAVARRVEAQHPELATLLLAAVEVASAPRKPGKGPNYLQASVMREALEHGRRIDWSDAVSSWKLRLAKLAQFVALGLLIAVCVGLASRGRALAGIGLLRPHAGVAAGAFEIKVDPGDVEIERGTSLLVVAEFLGAVPADATLAVSSDAEPADSSGKAPVDGAPVRELVSMVRSLDDPKFVGRIPNVAHDLEYRVEFAGHKSDTYRVKVFEYPELVRADAGLKFPPYTSLAPTIVEDVRHVTAVEGTQMTLICRLNKEVAEAQLIDREEQKTDLQQDATAKNVYRTAWTLARSQRFKLHLVDREGRTNRLPAEIVINVTPNRPPQVALERPGGDVEVSPLEELQLQAKISDDFGVERYGVSYALGGEGPREIVLTDAVKSQAEEHSETGPKTRATRQQAIEYMIDFESLNVEPDQLLSYYVWAEDFGPDGEPRRTMSDMYFAEVRPFEEIYRQGEQPSASEQQQREQQQQQGEGGAAQEAGELAQIEKDIINATWKLIRRETGAEPSAELEKDSQLLTESQRSAVDRLEELSERLQDAESLAHVKSAEKHMTEAHKHLTASADGPAIAPLRPALAAAQSAYQSLLKLRAREFQVIRGERRQGQRGQIANRGNRSQRQLQQLELSNEENRYETQRSASAPQENQAQRESREILNRLKDLARRQDDLNERLRELQSALQQADSRQRRDELERELKRLRDQQREILRDTDELMSRMDQSQNQQAAEQAREQMADGRSHVQQASEALEQGQLSQALTEGTRAGRQLQDIRDQYRQQEANRFSEEMTEMRRDARSLDEQHEQLSRQVEERQNEAGRSLRGSGSRAEAQEGLAQERRDLSRLLDRMQQTIQEAEQPEPLLARQLYDTLRETHQGRVDDALNITQRLLEVGIEREADQAMRAAGRGIRNLRQGVERAAESVLGDEAEALRRAQQEVDRLAEELNREIEQAQGERRAEQGGVQQRSQGRNQDGQQDSRSGSEDQNRQAQESQGQSRNSEGQQRDGKSDRGQEQGNWPGGGGRAGQDNEQRAAQDSQGENGQRERDPQGEGRSPRGNQVESQEVADNQPQSADAPEQQNGRGRGDAGNNENRERRGLRGNRGGSRDGDMNRPGGIERFLEDGVGGGPGGPITGQDFRNWSERIGDVEQMLEDPELRNEAARIRDRATETRSEFKRHSKLPDWNKLRKLVAEPLSELSRRIGEEIRRRESPDSLVPIDRDPVPPEFSDGVRRYYERLGSGE